MQGLDCCCKVVCSYAIMLNLANLAKEVQIAHRRRIKLEESNATTESIIQETLKRLVGELKNSHQEVFDALKNQTVDLVFNAHPTQSVRRSLLQKHGRILLSLKRVSAVGFGLVLGEVRLNFVEIATEVMTSRCCQTMENALITSIRNC